MIIIWINFEKVGDYLIKSGKYWTILLCTHSDNDKCTYSMYM